MAVEDSIEGENGINLDHPLVKLFRAVSIGAEAKDNHSGIYCPKCNLNLPSRQPFIGWDNEDRKASYYCPICDYEF